MTVTCAEIVEDAACSESPLTRREVSSRSGERVRDQWVRVTTHARLSS
jgi:hypothetical protein